MCKTFNFNTLGLTSNYTRTAEIQNSFAIIRKIFVYFTLRSGKRLTILTDILTVKGIFYNS